MSLNPQQTQPTSSVAIKHRQLAHLAAQFQTLAARTEQLERLTVTTAEQASYMRLLGAYHSSWSALLLPQQPSERKLTRRSTPSPGSWRPVAR